ncbi:hypothetical protein BKA66DRAFT_447037 [Pyrenochaeta sp. MPI-SDFR-AT-0127]|nr:hypothetical protein BKA66DRAFT_447037 [Pyrenochaeta sp. MPI-SDFR-AT-0127]
MVNFASYNPANDIPSLTGRVILITGGNIGLGRQSALDLSKHNPAAIWIAARTEQKAKATIAAINCKAPRVSTQFLELDLASFQSIKDAARVFLASVSRRDILFLNAGIMGCPPDLTKEGCEIHFGTNHVGRALFLKLLMPVIQKTASDHPGRDLRVVTVSSTAHKFFPSGGIQFDSLKSKTGQVSMSRLYEQSKLANVIYAREIAKRYSFLTSVSIHPGIVKTDLQSSGRDLMMRRFQKLVVPIFGVTAAECTKSQLWAATADGVVSGEYYKPVGVPGKGSALSKDKHLAKNL